MDLAEERMLALIQFFSSLEEKSMGKVRGFPILYLVGFLLFKLRICKGMGIAGDLYIFGANPQNRERRWASNSLRLICGGWWLSQSLERRAAGTGAWRPRPGARVGPGSQVTRRAPSVAECTGSRLSGVLRRPGTVSGCCAYCGRLSRRPPGARGRGPWARGWRPARGSGGGWEAAPFASAAPPPSGETRRPQVTQLQSAPELTPNELPSAPHFRKGGSGS